MREVAAEPGGIAPPHKQLLLTFATELVRARLLTRTAALLSAVCRTAFHDPLAGAWQPFCRDELVPTVQARVAEGYGDGAQLKLPDLRSSHSPGV